MLKSTEIVEAMGLNEAFDQFYPRSPREALQPQSVPSFQNDMKKNRYSLFVVFNGLLSLIMLFIFVIGGACYFIKMQLDAPGPLRSATTVFIPKGEGMNSIATRLRREGVIVDSSLFIAGAMIRQAGRRLQAGEFLFQEQISMDQVLDTLTYGDAILHKITIPEGRTSEQIVALLHEDETLIGDIEQIPPEGSLLPDTYKFVRGTERGDVLERMRKAQTQALQTVWEKRDKGLPLASPHEMVVLASIVEKETGRADERPRVASVFINRLRKSMRLQSDPTIVYGLVGGKGILGRPILKSDIERRTLYNTYRIDGLPPTPISNPGLAALEATANPSHTNDFYFVADGRGGHVFASDLRGHNRNVARWRNFLRQSENKLKLNGESNPPDDEVKFFEVASVATKLVETAESGRNMGNSGGGEVSMDKRETPVPPVMPPPVEMDMLRAITTR